MQVARNFAACDDILISCSLQWHNLRQLIDNNRSVASCQQTCCKLIAKTCYPQAYCKLSQQVGTSLQMANCSKLVLKK